MGRFTKYLHTLLPWTGRAIKEDGNFVNTANVTDDVYNAVENAITVHIQNISDVNNWEVSNGYLQPKNFSLTVNVGAFTLNADGNEFTMTSFRNDVRRVSPANTAAVTEFGINEALDTYTHYYAFVADTGSVTEHNVPSSIGTVSGSRDSTGIYILTFQDTASSPLEVSRLSVANPNTGNNIATSTVRFPDTNQIQITIRDVTNSGALTNDSFSVIFRLGGLS